MKILHTSDWHLGHLLYNYDRSEEQFAMLAQMEDIIRAQQPDVFLLCGDVYHTSQPSAAVQTMFTDALVRFHQACPQMTIVITAGNHDSGTKHEIFRTPWLSMNVHAIGTLDKEHPDTHIISIPNVGFVIAIPYVNERNIPEGFIPLLTDQVAAINTHQLPVIISAHTTVKGCDFQGHDQGSDLSVGGIDSIDVQELGTGFDYCALGHIHHQQFVVGGKHRVRYCGTPIPVSFDEQYPHSVSLVTMAHHGDTPIIEQISIDNPHPLVTLPTQDLADWETVKQLLRDYPAHIAAYIRLNVEVTDFLPVEANAEANALTEGKACRFCYINAKRKVIPNASTNMLTIQEFQTEKPIDIARRYAADINVEFTNELEFLFTETQKMVTNENTETHHP